jgi:hypothetical protein
MGSALDLLDEWISHRHPAMFTRGVPAVGSANRAWSKNPAGKKTTTTAAFEDPVKR